MSGKGKVRRDAVAEKYVAQAFRRARSGLEQHMMFRLALSYP
jgi:hypothetical protein